MCPCPVKTGLPLIPNFPRLKWRIYQAIISFQTQSSYKLEPKTPFYFYTSSFYFNVKDNPTKTLYRGCLSLQSWYINPHCSLDAYLWRNLNDLILATLQTSENIVFFSLYFGIWKYRVQVCSSTIFTHIFIQKVIHIILKNGTWACMHSMFFSWKTISKHLYSAPKH